MFKRVFDLIVSVWALVVLWPVMLLVAWLIKRDSPGPALYRARRVGRGGTEFTLYKFRTMHTGADKAGPGITTASDRRITQVGHFLRKTKLDELPQLLNILRGDMSIVGPRPEDPRYVAHYTPEQRRVLEMRPGLTSPASIAYRHESELLKGDDWEQQYIEEIMPAKLALDLDYVRKASVVRDIQIIFQTATALFRPGAEGAGN